jgi:hypothetical protein
MSTEAEEIWRSAVRQAQHEVDGLDADVRRMQSAMESLQSRAGMLDHSTVDVDATIEESVVRADRLGDVTASGAKDVRRALIDATNCLDDLRRALDFYHH